MKARRIGCLSETRCKLGVKRGVEGWLEVRQPHSPDPAVFAHVSYSQRPTKNRRR